MKKFIIGLVLGSLLTISTTAFSANVIKIFVNGKEIKPDVAPVIIQGRTMVPVRWVAEALGAEVNWDNATQTVSIDLENNQKIPDEIKEPDYENMSDGELIDILNKEMRELRRQHTDYFYVIDYSIDSSVAKNIWTNISRQSRESYLREKLDEMKNQDPKILTYIIRLSFNKFADYVDPQSGYASYDGLNKKYNIQVYDYKY